MFLMFFMPVFYTSEIVTNFGLKENMGNINNLD